jgi:hypothetical protein
MLPIFAVLQARHDPEKWDPVLGIVLKTLR